MNNGKEKGKYVIAHLLEGEEFEFHRNLAREISDKFGVSCVSDEIEPHITIKYFTDLLDNRQVRNVEDYMMWFVQGREAPSYRLEGTGCFEENVVFIDVAPSDDMRRLYGDFLDGLYEVDNFSKTPFEGNDVHFHSTLAHKDIRGNFEEIYSFAKGRLEDVCFNCSFNNIALLKEESGVWRTHSKFLIKGDLDFYD